MKANSNKDYGIRLYCIRINDNTVILLNGGIKTTRKAQDCPHVKKHFKLAIAIANKLDSAINSREIDILDENCLEDYIIEL